MNSTKKNIVKKSNESFVTIMLKLVGTECNMCCHYCYERSLDSQFKILRRPSTEEVIQYLSHFKEYERVFIVFHGGEPLLAPIDTMRQILEFIDASFNNTCHMQIQTNGTLLTEAWMALLKLFTPKLSISISLEPATDIDLRKATEFDYRDRVLENIRKYKNNFENIGIVSVAHKGNKDGFCNFISQLQEMGIQNLTINKYRSEHPETDPYYLTEEAYVDLIIQTFKLYVFKKWYEKIAIQPIVSLYSNEKCRLCTYMNDENKCNYFRTFYNAEYSFDCCEHLISNKPILPDICRHCEIYFWCGGGCPAESKDSTFCQSRKRLKAHITEIMHEN